MCSAASATRGPSLHTGRLFIFLFFFRLNKFCSLLKRED